jgi:serine/threonine-protein kinase
VSSADPDLWPKVQAALEAALSAEPDKRSGILDRLCDGDAIVRQEVESLLSAYDASDGFLDTSAESFAAPFLTRAAELSPTERAGVLVGRYRLVEEVGRGGMGTVWLAERADGQFEQRVALKLVKRGMDTEEILSRFLRERQILARLEHPNIARLLDGGVSADDRPYFVMEHVAGAPIIEHCDARKLTVEERLRLFVVVCRAVGYAHRNLVVHRDIKPSNVLVDSGGTIKLLDFGIAKLLSDENVAPTLMTRESSGLMTPEYASPEQLAGERVTTASDVYQLGALLYELLCGRRSSSPAEPNDAVGPPSARIRRTRRLTGRGGNAIAVDPDAIGDRRSTSPDKLRRQLRGDLDSIVLRALRREPDLRYPSAEDLAGDIERHLSSQPIRFGGDRFSYRARKFVRRHRLAVTTALGALALTIGLVTFDLARVRAERDRARHEADKAMETAQLMGRFLEGWSPDASDRGEVSTEKMLRDAALRAERELRDRPEMLSATLSVLGDFHTTVGEWSAADSLLTRAQGIQERLFDRPNSDLAATLVRRGRLDRQRGDHARAEASLQRALSMHRELFGARHIETLRVERELAILRRLQERWEESEAMSRAILGSINEEDLAISPFALETATDLGYALFQQARFDEAIEILRPTLTRQRAIFGEIHASTLFTIRALGSSHRDRGDLDEAEALYREALRIARTLYGEEHQETEAALFVLALVLQRKEALAEAEEYARRSLALSERIHGHDHFQKWGRVGLIGTIRLDRGDEVEAERDLRIVLEAGRSSGQVTIPGLGDVLNRLAYILVRRDAGDAEAVYGEAVAIDDALPAGSPLFVTDGVHFLAWAEHRRGDVREAEDDYRRALALYRRQLPDGHAYRAAAASGLGALLLDLGRPTEARRYLREGLSQWDAHDPPEPDRIREVRELLARADSTTGGR